MRYYIQFADADEIAVDVTRSQTGRLNVTVDGEPYPVDAVRTADTTNIIADDRVFELFLEKHAKETRFVTAGLRSAAVVESERARLGKSAQRGGSSGGSVTAPMPGRVVKLLVEVGQEVAAGTPVVVVEAMKMENELRTERPGVVESICAQEGDNVDGGTTLVKLGTIASTDD
jgi:glutaconyl-CoA/methylmalonyl-CoA decarboxylase subunit gamma